MRQEWRGSVKEGTAVLREADGDRVVGVERGFRENRTLPGLSHNKMKGLTSEHSA